MGYSNGTRWSDEKIIESIKEVVDKLDLKTFPTKTQMESYYHNSNLRATITRTGGSKYWADMLGLPIKDCESKAGEIFEFYCLEKLEDMGYSVSKMKPHYPYDLAVNNHIKVDVKSGYVLNNYGNTGYYTFNLYKAYPTCDIYVIYCLNDDKTIEKTYIIPSAFLLGKTQLTLGKTKSKYDQFIDRWDYFEIYDKFYSKLGDK